MYDTRLLTQIYNHERVLNNFRRDEKKILQNLFDISSDFKKLVRRRTFQQLAYYCFLYKLGIAMLWNITFQFDSVSVILSKKKMVKVSIWQWLLTSKIIHSNCRMQQLNNLDFIKDLFICSRISIIFTFSESDVPSEYECLTGKKWIDIDQNNSEYYILFK